VLEVLEGVDRVSGSQIARRIEPRRAGDPDSLISANERIRETLDWRPKYADLDTIIAHALAWEGSLRASCHHPEGV